MSTDDTMRRIEEALDLYGSACFMEVGDGTVECVERTMQRRSALLATIRAALDAQPSPTSGESPAVSAEVAQKDAGGWGEDDDRHRANEEHERAVEAWRDEAVRTPKFSSVFYTITQEGLLEALRLMRRQPTVQKPTNPSTVSSSETKDTETTDGK